MSLAADDAGLPDDPEFRSALVGYLEWGTRLAVHNSQAGADVPAHAPVPHRAGAKRLRTNPREEPMPQKPTLCVCDGDDGGPKLHPCRRVQETMRAAGIGYEKVIAAQGSPFPFLRRGSRAELETATGARKLPALVLSDGTVLRNSGAILRWVGAQRS